MELNETPKKDQQKEKPKTAVLIDDDQLLLESLKECIQILFHVKCLTFSSYEEVTERQEEVMDPNVLIAIVDINLGPGKKNGMDIYYWLRQHGFRSKIVFLTGHAVGNPLVKSIASLNDAQVFEKPIGVETLESLIQ